MSDSLAGVLAAVRNLAVAGEDGARVDQIRALEELKAAASAAQAWVTTCFVDSQRAAQRAAGVPAERAERGIAAQVGLAKRCSPHAAARFAGWAKVLTGELPQTLAALRRGEITEWRATLLARETVFLSREHRAQVDAEVAPRAERLGDRRLVAEARALAYRLDPAGFVARQRQAERDRRVTLRPVPEVMTRLTATLPMAQGVASHVALGRAADALIAAGDPRSRGQVMADLLVQRLTGQASAAGTPIEVNLVISTDTLLGDGDEPAHLDGVGPVPAPAARDLVLDTDAPVWLRRVFTAPGSGRIVALETRRRLFTAGQRRWVRLRDRYCRTPWCEAPIRHADHLLAHEHGGKTSVANAQGLCVACNHAKQAPGWRARPGPGAAIDLITPTGHRYRSHPAPPRGHQRGSPLERRAADLIWPVAA
ncbi:MAG: HNH endonuclease [Jatrophihabitans sp.]|nr:MAG: HNH endonuclease [Jatrophihabitans sp.]